MTKSICIYVQSLLGSGHLFRMIQIANALHENHYDVHIISGSKPLKKLPLKEGIHFHQQPFIQAKDEHFSDYIDEDGQSVTETWWENRKEHLYGILNQFNFDAFITETYPFGRRLFRKELIPAIEMLKKKNPAIKIISSIRDILNPKPKVNDRSDEIIDVLNQYFDAILIHADPELIPFEKSFPKLSNVRIPHFYTNYIHHNETLEGNSKKQQVIFSVGGGRVGSEMLNLCLSAVQLLKGQFPHIEWLFISGQHNQTQNISQDKLIFTDYVPNLCQTMKESLLSISQAGYNTVCDLLNAKANAIILPFENESQKEQLIRAIHLYEALQIPFLPKALQTVENLVSLIERQLTNPVQMNQTINLEGIDQSVWCLGKILNQS